MHQLLDGMALFAEHPVPVLTIKVKVIDPILGFQALLDLLDSFLEAFGFAFVCRQVVANPFLEITRLDLHFRGLEDGEGR